MLFISILDQLQLLDSYKRKRVIVVGIGNGFEGKLLYSEIERLSILDIAPNSLNQANMLLPHANPIHNAAEKMTSILNNSFDLYISLRTYQSTYFDIHNSLLEAKRVLTQNGSIIISVVCGYKNDSDKIVYGLYNPYTGVLETERPLIYIKSIEHKLINIGFKIVGTMETQTEIFLYAVCKCIGI
jgi:ubiquinone/menaquinone biosynthesis C-methylase UbiE